LTGERGLPYYYTRDPEILFRLKFISYLHDGFSVHRSFLMKKICVAAFTAALLMSAVSLTFPIHNQPGNTRVESFSRAKKFLMKKVYYDHRTTIYCGCSYSEDKTVARETCGYIPKRPGKRARRVEWEHVVPAHAFGQSFREWREGDPVCVNSRGRKFKGRRCATKANRLFRYMQADMYNLYPAIGEVNMERSNYSMAMIPGEKREFGACDIEIENRKVEPRPAVRGDIARTYFYMEAAYPGRGIISRKNRPLFMAWNRADPVDKWECRRARRIFRIQGNRNNFVMDACAAAGL